MKTFKVDDQVVITRGELKGAEGIVSAIFTNIIHVKLLSPTGGALLEIRRMLPSELKVKNDNLN